VHSFEFIKFLVMVKTMVWNRLHIRNTYQNWFSIMNMNVKRGDGSADAAFAKCCLQELRPAHGINDDERADK
jgi:hypothetical protein